MAGKAHGVQHPLTSVLWFPPSPHTFRALPSVPPLKCLHARPILGDPSFWTGLVLICLRLSWFGTNGPCPKKRLRSGKWGGLVAISGRIDGCFSSLSFQLKCPSSEWPSLPGKPRLTPSLPPPLYRITLFYFLPSICQ